MVAGAQRGREDRVDEKFALTQDWLATEFWGNVAIFRMHNARKGDSFSFETTLSGRGYSRMIPVWQAQGYQVKLFFLRLPTQELAIARVNQRVSEGGHNVPDAIVRRRFHSGLRNFEHIYRDMVDEWALYDNSGDRPILISEMSK